MKKTYYFLLTLTALLLSAVNVGAQLVPAADNNSYYYIQFRHNASINAVMEDMGSGNVMKAQTRTLGKDAQLWRVTAGATQGSYVFTSKLGNKIVWDSGTSRYKTSSSGTGADIKLLYSNNATYTKSFELQRVGSTQAFNVWGGVAIKNDIAEYTVGDAGGTVIFVRAPEISSIDNSAERWYWLKSFRDNGKTVNTSNAGADFNPASPATSRKFKVVKDAANTTYGLVYHDGSNYNYLQAGAADNSDPAPFSTTAHTGFSAFTPTATAGTGAGSAAGFRGWRIFRPGSSVGMFHMKVVGGGYSLRYNDTGAEDANVWSFFDAKDVLGENYVEVFAFYNQTTEGNKPGEYSASARAALKTALDASLALYNNPAALESELLTQSANLTTAFNTYKAAVNLIKASDGTNTYWYQIRDKRSPAVYWNIATVGTTANALNTTTTSNPTANSQLFKFVQAPSPAIGYYIYSKTNETTALSAPATTDGSIISIDAAQTATSWKFETASPGYFLVMTETELRQLNSYSDKISFYQGGVSDPGNNWKLVELDLTVLKNTYTQKRTEARALHTKTANYEGTDFGQYSAASRSSFNGVITTEEAKNVETLSFNQLEEGINTLQSAIDTFKATINNTLTTLLPASSENYRWYRIKSTATNAYAAGKVISAGTRAVGDNFTFETIADPVTDAQLFRFVLNNDNSKILHIINKKDGKFMASNGAIADASTVSNEFALNLLNDGISYNIKPTSVAALHAQEAGAHIVNWAGVEGSASAWVLEYVTETALPPSKTVTVSSANSNQGIAVINGTSNISASSRESIAVKATPASAEYYFVNWTNADGGAVISTSNPYTYSGTSDIDLVANFATNGIPVAPMASTTEHPVYYLIQSASNATHSYSSYTGDFRGNVLISPTAAGKLIHNKLSTATSADHALWQIVNLEGVQLLKNKATGLYMTDSHSVGATGEAANAFTFDFINGSTTQYKLRTANANVSYTASWQSNLCDRLNVGDQPNSLIAWYFIAPAFTGTSDFSNTTDWTNGAIPSDDMAVAINSNATITADKAFNGLHIAAGKTLTVNAGKGLTVRNAITGGGTLILKSDATNGTATVTGNVSGMATVEQHLPAATERTWWYLASPVTGAAWTVFGSNQVGSYSEATRSYSQPFTAAETLEAGRGYVVKMNASEAATYQFANRALNNGNISVPLTRTVSETLNNKRGFNLVGNPYPSYLNWEMAYNASTNIRSTIWYRTKGASSMEFHTYNAALGVSVPTSASGYIPPMQAFWVKVDTDPVSPATVSNGTLNFTNAMRGHANSSENRLKAPAVSSLPILRLELRNGTSSDETVIALHENASDNFDRYDSEKMSSAGTTEVFTLTGTQELVINALQTSEGSKSVRLGIRPDAAGNFTLSATEVKNMDEVQVILHDHQLNTQTELQLNESYSFTSDATATNDRFSLELRAPGMTTGNENPNGKLTLTTTEGRISIDGTTEGSPISIYNALGQQLMTQTASSSYTELNHKFQPGIYIVRINNASIKVTVK